MQYQSVFQPVSRMLMTCIVRPLITLGYSVADSISAFNANPKIPRTPDGVPGPMNRGSGDASPPQPIYSDSLPTHRPESGGRVIGQYLFIPLSHCVCGTRAPAGS